MRILVLSDTHGDNSRAYQVFDKLKKEAAGAVKQAVQSAASTGNKTETITFAALPESLAEMQTLPEATLDTPFKTAALTVCALCAYADDFSKSLYCVLKIKVAEGL